MAEPKGPHCNIELFNSICSALEAHGKHDIYFDGFEIICSSQARADVIADFLEALGIDDVMCTGEADEGSFYVRMNGM